VCVSEVTSDIGVLKRLKWREHCRGIEVGYRIGRRRCVYVSLRQKIIAGKECWKHCIFQYEARRHTRDRCHLKYQADERLDVTTVPLLGQGKGAPKGDRASRGAL
jgi:hypothetical protein